ncbi:MAG: hypothetical protein OXI01_08000 [Albidovulum sp.]|nr:hypothetical protein [Albidovulum sp.]
MAFAVSRKPDKGVMLACKKIGLLWPADGRNDREFWNWLPNSVSVLIARYDVEGGLKVSHLEKDGEPARIAAAARILRHARPDVFALGDCAAGFIGGAELEKAQIRAVSSISHGKPVVSMTASIARALECVEARIVAVLSPYDSEVTERFEKYLCDFGILVGASRCLSARSEIEIENVSVEWWMNEAKAVDADLADALVVPGGGVSLSNSISGLERHLDKPVICGPGALMWAALSGLSINHASENRGNLFRIGFGNASKT